MTNKYTVTAAVEKGTGCDLLIVHSQGGTRLGAVRFPGGLRTRDPQRVLAAIEPLLSQDGRRRVMYVVPSAD